MSSGDQAKSDQREPYEPPQINEIGSVRELTAGAKNKQNDGAGQLS